jgi:hypothetical protein
MSMGLGEEENNKSKTKTMDQMKDKSSLPKEAATTTAATATTSSSLPPAQSEVFDSSSDDAMSEMKQIADMRQNEASKVFSHVEEKQHLDPQTASVDDDTVQRAIPENNLTTNPASTPEPTLQETDRSVMESKEEDAVLIKDIEPDIAHIDNVSEGKQSNLDESVTVYDNGNKVSNSNLSSYYIYNPYIIGIKFWQAYSIAWFRINTLLMFN